MCCTGACVFACKNHGMEFWSQRGLAAPQLYWVGLGCLVLSVGAFLGGFMLGNAQEPRNAMFFVVVGLVASIILSVLAVVLSIAGMVAFAHLRGRFILLLFLCVVFSPLLWLGIVATAL